MIGQSSYIMMGSRELIFLSAIEALNLLKVLTHILIYLKCMY